MQDVLTIVVILSVIINFILYVRMENRVSEKLHQNEAEYVDRLEIAAGYAKAWEEWKQMSESFIKNELEAAINAYDLEGIARVCVERFWDTFKVPALNKIYSEIQARGNLTAEELRQTKDKVRDELIDLFNDYKEQIVASASRELGRSEG